MMGEPPWPYSVDILYNIYDFYLFIWMIWFCLVRPLKVALLNCPFLHYLSIFLSGKPYIESQLSLVTKF